jgi:cytochrome c-type biogenesis protein
MLQSVDPLAAIVGGLLSFLSPCVLALVPGYVAYLSGASVEGASRRGLLANAAVFVAAFSGVFILLFAVLKALVVHLPRQSQDLLTQLGAVLIIILGLQFLGLFRAPLLMRDTRLQLAHRFQPGSPIAAAVLGVTFALGWTPCVGPILTFILLRASSAHELVGGTGLMLLYCAGLAVPFLLVAALFDRVRPALRAVNRRAHAIELASGALLVAVGVLLFTGEFARINQWFGPLARYLPQG